jgi:predicted Zn-dependent peptidase
LRLKLSPRKESITQSRRGREENATIAGFRVRLAWRTAAWALFFLMAVTAAAQQINVEEHVLDNGMRVLLLPRRGSANIFGGWIARVGSVDERPGITGISHLFEHMMFKGTTTIGTRDPEEDARLNLEMDRVKAEMRKEEQKLAERVRMGEVTDPKDPKVRTAKHNELLAKFDILAKRQSELLVKNEFDRIYTSEGASRMNAGTSEDFTIYFINVPANKLELWFWMESDRLAHPVFREFYTERDVVHEERRMRTDSTPTGRYMEQFDAMFWKSSPYGWPVVGWPSDLEAITREEANAYFGTYYAPNNLTACLVGDFDTKTAMELANKYFGRLQRGATEPEPVRTTEMPQLAEQRMTAYAETTPEALIRYHTVADGHVDDAPLNIVASLMNDRTGRLYKALVLDQQIATAAFANQESRKYEGFMQFRGVARPGKDPADVEKAIYKEIEKLQNEMVPDRELEKVKNNIAAANFRRQESDFALLTNILVNDADRGWKVLNTDPKLLEAVTPADIQRVAKRYFLAENRDVLLFYRKSGGAK